MMLPLYERGLPAELVDEKPKCFTQPQWDRWVAGEVVSTEPLDLSGFCGSCTPEHRDEMALQVRCRYPRVEFTYDDEEGLVGHRPPEFHVIRRALVPKEIGRTLYLRLKPVIDRMNEEAEIGLKEQLAKLPPGTVV